MVFDFYSISLKRNFNAKFRYGQQQYDFDEGIMFFISPGQVFGIEVNEEPVAQGEHISLVNMLRAHDKSQGSQPTALSVEMPSVCPRVLRS